MPKEKIRQQNNGFKARIEINLNLIVKFGMIFRMAASVKKRLNFPRGILFKI
jgi:hypothetical protein